VKSGIFNQLADCTLQRPAPHAVDDFKVAEFVTFDL